MSNIVANEILIYTRQTPSIINNLNGGMDGKIGGDEKRGIREQVRSELGTDISKKEKTCFCLRNRTGNRSKNQVCLKFGTL